MPGIAAPIDSRHAITRACMSRTVSSCTALIAGNPLNAVAGPPITEATQAKARFGAAARPR